MLAQCWRQHLPLLEMLQEPLGTRGSMEKVDHSPGTPQRELELCSHFPQPKSVQSLQGWLSFWVHLLKSETQTPREIGLVLSEHALFPLKLLWNPVLPLKNS